MEQDLIQIFELFLALAAAVVAFWQHRQKLVAVDTKDEALIERDLAEARQWESEALKDNVISFFDPEDESVVKAPPEVAARSWKMSDETKRWIICRAHGRGPGIAAEADRGCGRAEEDPVPDLGARVLLRDRVRVIEGRWERGVNMGYKYT